MSLRFHEIAEANHWIQNPLTDDKLMLLGEVTRVDQHTRILDIACGKGELLCRWAAAHRVSGHGVDVSHVFLAAANARAVELGVADRLSFSQGDAEFFQTDERFAVVSCLGAMWFAGGLDQSLTRLRGWASDDALILVGHPYWIEEPPDGAYEAFDPDRTENATLIGTLDRFEQQGLHLVEMVLADGDSWDRYDAAQWWTVNTWLRADPDDPDHAAVRGCLRTWQRRYLEYGRRYLGWGVFVLRQSRFSPLDRA